MKKVCLLLLTLLVLLSSCGHQHIWIEADCTHPKTCSECGKTEGEALGHSWVDATHQSPKTCSRCGETEGGILLYEVTPSFYKHCEFGEFNRFNSYASENGLAGTMIWLEGVYENVSFIDMPDVMAGAQTFISDFVDADGHIWTLELDTNVFSTIEKYQDLIGHQLLITGEYIGYSSVKQMPGVLIEKIFDKTTGNIIISTLYSIYSK